MGRGRDRQPKQDGAGEEPDDAVDVFAQAMADVVRLPADVKGRVRAAPRAASEVSGRPLQPPAEPSGPEPPDGVEAFVAPGIDRRETRRLKRGDYPATDRLDLHGLTAAEASDRVARFIENSRHRGHRCVCIVHGRGLHSTGGAPVLKTRVRAQLKTAQAVLAYADAPAAAGGAGAVYVLLRK